MGEVRELCETYLFVKLRTTSHRSVTGSFQRLRGGKGPDTFRMSFQNLGVGLKVGGEICETLKLEGRPRRVGECKGCDRE